MKRPDFKHSGWGFLLLAGFLLMGKFLPAQSPESLPPEVIAYPEIVLLGGKS